MNPVTAATAAAVEMLRPTIRPTLDPRIAAIITGCWHPDPAHRPSARQISEELERVFPQDDSRGASDVASRSDDNACCAVA